MKKFILSDLHIGYEGAQYDALDRVIAYIQREAKVGDEIWGLGDWFHMYEKGFEYCLKHPMTQKFRDLAGQIPTKLLPGNHDHALEKYRDNPDLGNPLAPIKLVGPFMEGGIWYCHGHEYDPAVRYVPQRLMWLLNHLPGAKMTPSKLKAKTGGIYETYIMLVYLIHSRALLSLQERVKKEHLECKGVVLGHTHLPLYQGSPEMLFLLNDGDTMDSATFTVEDDTEFRQLTWNQTQQKWRVTSISKP